MAHMGKGVGAGLVTHTYSVCVSHLGGGGLLVGQELVWSMEHDVLLPSAPHTHAGPVVPLCNGPTTHTQLRPP